MGGMSEKAYIKNPKGTRGGVGKFGTNEQDLEDFEQELQIREWLEREGKLGEVPKARNAKFYSRRN
jgi:hypothetical protein